MRKRLIDALSIADNNPILFDHSNLVSVPNECQAIFSQVLAHLSNSLNRLVASIPSMTGICKSISTTSKAQVKWPAKRFIEQRKYQ